MKRTYNFNAGPAAIPLAVLEKAQSELVDFNGTGMSVMELSHRSKPYEEVHNRASALLKELMGIPEEYEVLFLQGGASLQFAMIPMNFLKSETDAHFIMSGVWSEKAQSEASKIGNTNILASSKDDRYTYIPETFEDPAEGSYIHLTSNNTIYGTRWQDFPITKLPLIADMSSDIMSREFDVSRFSLIYAGAQKNLGPSGVTVVIVKKDMLAETNEQIPAILKYSTHSKQNSLYNTPPTFAIYMLSLVLEWIQEQGGLAAIEALNNKKASLLYDCIDQSGGFYRGHAEKTSRSAMNVTFTLKNEELTKAFIKESIESGFSGLGGHRSIGGCRASIYNAVPLEACQALADFMANFQKKHA
ncbi:3-phosphoserine/phosphohydroxythreonine transaminase [Bacillus sp. UMB0893]|uniref:3-phosphoserine/phosphohydroxythreonine transaminase n=1 Tax=Bacillus sp. UMB0893 TaxID=2066053 RepID=UPI000C780FF0|nr:3-phosphoserine/phosphohydroxythreonine transaminase [Bacillus sp. UMB0893]PLR67443.1 3-phosphoserine/phosphohydroxythreonine transaminase [Bacillus sp. UMB0893]